MKINEIALIEEVIEQVPFNDGKYFLTLFQKLLNSLFLVELLISNLSEQFIERLLQTLAEFLDNSRHVEFYLHWTESILTIHGPKIKAQQNMPALLSLQKSLTKKYEQLAKL